MTELVMLAREIVVQLYAVIMLLTVIAGFLWWRQCVSGEQK
jgi:hypothetical protein